MGREWYDFVAVLINGRIIPGKVIRIVKVGQMERFVVHTTSLPRQPRYDFYKELKNDFITPFELGQVSCIHIVDV